MAGISSSTLTLEVIPKASSIAFVDDSLQVVLEDGRTVLIPLSWYPRLDCANDTERNDWEFFQEGAAIHWPTIDEDIRITDLLAGRHSEESAASLKRWKANR